MYADMDGDMPLKGVKAADTNSDLDTWCKQVEDGYVFDAHNDFNRQNNGAVEITLPATAYSAAIVLPLTQAPKENGQASTTMLTVLCLPAYISAGFTALAQACAIHYINYIAITVNDQGSILTADCTEARTPVWQ